MNNNELPLNLKQIIENARSKSKKMILHPCILTN